MQKNHVARQAFVPIYRCAECECVGPAEHFVYDPYESLYVCGECGEHVNHEGDRRAEWVSVALYTVSRDYGGPEEGGWWYDTFELIESTVRCFEFGDIPSAESYAERLHNTPKVHGERLAVIVTAERLPHQALPLHRPVYC